MTGTSHAPDTLKHGGLLIGLMVGAIVLGGLLVAALLAGVLWLGATSPQAAAHDVPAAPVPVEAR